MPLLTPQFDFRRIQEIPTSCFVQHGIRALLLDVDNTLTGDNSQEVKPEVAEWLARQQQAGLRLFVISNNREARVAPFAGRLGLGYIAEAEKPKTRVVLAKMKEFGVSPQQTALIGDQLFTDILCGNLCGCMTILVEPYAPEGYGLYRIKRPLEKPFLRLYRRRNQRRGTV